MWPISWKDADSELSHQALVAAGNEKRDTHTHTEEATVQHMAFLSFTAVAILCGITLWHYSIVMEHPSMLNDAQ